MLLFHSIQYFLLSAFCHLSSFFNYTRTAFLKALFSASLIDIDCFLSALFILSLCTCPLFWHHYVLRDIQRTFPDIPCSSRCRGSIFSGSGLSKKPDPDQIPWSHFFSSYIETFRVNIPRWWKAWRKLTFTLMFFLWKQIVGSSL